MWRRQANDREERMGYLEMCGETPRRRVSHEALTDRERESRQGKVEIARAVRFWRSARNQCCSARHFVHGFRRVSPCPIVRGWLPVQIPPPRGAGGAVGHMRLRSRVDGQLPRCN
jgi:hypothetical protein